MLMFNFFTILMFILKKRNCDFLQQLADGTIMQHMIEEKKNNITTGSENTEKDSKASKKEQRRKKAAGGKGGGGTQVGRKILNKDKFKGYPYHFKIFVAK